MLQTHVRPIHFVAQYILTQTSTFIKMKKIQLIAQLVFIACALVSCQKEEVNENEELQTATAAIEISDEHKEALIKAGVNPTNATYTVLNHLDGSSSKGILSSDIFLRLDRLGEYALESGADGTKQYRTTNLVDQNSTINVIGYTGSGFALTPVMQQGLQFAIDNYNNVNTSLTFNLTFTASTNGDIIIYNAGGSDAGAVAEFPSNGNPGFTVAVFGGMNNFDNQINEHLMTHEIGHCLGFRHTDYALRKCDGSNEGTTSFGAIYIPGTPSVNQYGASGLDNDSVMISCFEGNEDGEFSNFDIVALQYMY